MTELIEYIAVILPTKHESIKSYWDDMRPIEGNLYNCVDPNNPEQMFRLVKVTGEKFYFYPYEYDEVEGASWLSVGSINEIALL